MSGLDLNLSLRRTRSDIADAIADLDPLIALRPEKGGAELTLAKRKLQEARHWLGECQRENGFVAPYPN